LKKGKIRITVKLFATLRENRFEQEIREYNTNTTPAVILDGLNIAESTVSIVFVNGRHADLDRALEDKDVVAFFPPIGGG
jgi:molybdopterin converting factor small subunit